jgi:hypothetical protein
MRLGSAERVPRTRRGEAVRVVTLTDNTRGGPFMSPGRGGAAVASEGRGDEGSVVREETFVVIGAVVSTLVCAGDIELRVIDRGV